MNPVLPKTSMKAKIPALSGGSFTIFDTIFDMISAAITAPRKIRTTYLQLFRTRMENSICMAVMTRQG